MKSTPRMRRMQDECLQIEVLRVANIPCRYCNPDDESGKAAAQLIITVKRSEDKAHQYICWPCFSDKIEVAINAQEEVEAT